MPIPSILLPHTGTYTPATGNHGDGDTYGDPVPIRCRVERRTDTVTDSTGRTRTTTARVFLPPAESWAPEPGGLLSISGTVFTVVTVDTLVDITGRPFHHELKAA